MGKIKIGASTLSVDQSMLAYEVGRAERGGVDFIHIDFIDGRFGPRVITVGLTAIERLTKHVKIPVRVHCYVADPHNTIDEYLEISCESITVHVEASPFLYYIAQKVHEAGKKVGVALLPPTPPSSIEYILNEIDLVEILGIDPIGLGGQSFIKSMLRKIKRVKEMMEDVGVDVEICVDGGVNKFTIHEIVGAGADSIVAGTAIYGADNIEEAVKELRRISEEALKSRERARRLS